jgi:hypothetical protein
MKRVSILAFLLIFTLAALTSAADLGKRDVFRIGDAEFTSATEIVVPISVTHDENLVAMDIPLEWSKGVTLTNVSFEGTRVDYFDAKVQNIDEENNRVVIGLFSMVYEHKDALTPGNGEIAKLTFRIDDATLDQFELKPFVKEDSPAHRLSLVYNDNSSGLMKPASVSPEVEGSTILLDKSTGSNPVVPAEYTLKQNYPNPFNPSTTIFYSLKNAGQVELHVYNVLGQNVRSLVSDFQPAGEYSVKWDGRDNTGNSVASGVYFYKINSGDFSEIKKMVLMK